MAKILIVDDNIDMLDTLEHLFTFYDFEVVRAENGREALAVAEREKPGLIILDALMPVMNGFEACEKLKSNPQTRDIPVIFLSANYTRLEHQQKGIELGADDYILKPFNSQELITKITSLLHRRRLIEKLRNDNQQLLHRKCPPPERESLPAAGDNEAAKDFNIDPLTGLYNNRFFQQRFEEEYRHSLNAGGGLALALVDADMFRRINEIYSEQTADYVLMRIANVILHNSRAAEVVFRLENNKFALLLRLPEDPAFEEAERIRSAVQRTQFFEQDFFQLKKVSPRQKQALENVTVSIGVAALQKQISKNDLLQQAQDSLAQAKARGRNRTVRFSEIQNT